LTVIRFTWEDVMQRPRFVATTILQLLGKVVPV
jgi:hypothetical protein